MEVVAKHNNWLLYSDGKNYVFNVRCSYGIAEPTATFPLNEEEIMNYLSIGEEFLHEISMFACTSSGKHYFEKTRPISEELNRAVSEATKRYLDSR